MTAITAACAPHVCNTSLAHRRREMYSTGALRCISLCCRLIMAPAGVHTFYDGASREWWRISAPVLDFRWQRAALAASSISLICSRVGGRMMMARFCTLAHSDNWCHSQHGDAHLRAFRSFMGWCSSCWYIVDDSRIYSYYEYVISYHSSMPARRASQK